MMSTFLPYADGFLAAYTILLIGALSPGPSVALLVGIASDQGRAPAMAATLGIAFGSATLNVLTLAGVRALITKVNSLEYALTTFGAVYLVYLAYGSFVKAVSPPKLIPRVIEKTPSWRHFTSGYILQVSNPKAIAFWLTITSVGAVSGAPLWIVMVYVFVGFLISFTGHGAWAMMMSTNSARAIYSRNRRYIEAVLGCFLLVTAWSMVLQIEF